MISNDTTPPYGEVSGIMEKGSVVRSIRYIIIFLEHSKIVLFLHPHNNCFFLARVYLTVGILLQNLFPRIIISRRRVP